MLHSNCFGLKCLKYTRNHQERQNKMLSEDGSTVLSAGCPESGSFHFGRLDGRLLLEFWSQARQRWEQEGGILTSWTQRILAPVVIVLFLLCPLQYALYKKMTQAAILIQSKFRSYYEQKRFQQSRRAAVLIQNFYRSYKKCGRRRPARRTAVIVQQKLRWVTCLQGSACAGPETWQQLCLQLLQVLWLCLAVPVLFSLWDPFCNCHMLLLECHWLTSI